MKKHRAVFLTLMICLFIQQDALAKITWTPLTKMDGLFPSLILSTATMPSKAPRRPDYFGDPHGQVGVSISASDDNVMVRVIVSSTKLIKPSKQDALLSEGGRTYGVFPLLEYDYDVLNATREPFPETVTIDVELFGRGASGRPVMVAKNTKKLVIQVRSINDCPILLRHENRTEDFKWMFGAYVNENHRVVEGILQEGLKTGIVNHFDGYQKDEADVALQIFAIWNVFQTRGIKYSDITTPSSYSEKVFSQHVRFIGDSLNYQQANCVDGSVLFASVFRKIGLETFLVLVPKHCFVGVWLDKKKTKPFYLETTMLGTSVSKDSSFKPDSILGAVNEAREKHPESFNAFVAANRSAAKKNHDLMVDDSVKNSIYRIDISDCRRRGIQPLKDDYLK